MMSLSNAIECEDTHTLQLVRGILDLFPAKRHLGQPLADLLSHLNERDVLEKQRLQGLVQEAKSKGQHSSTVQDIKAKRKADIERQIESGSLQVRQMQEQINDLENLDQLQMRKYG